ncbi:hypothetical protein JCM11251_000236 [Rhodosporidiobolus azoricus]
MAADWQMGRLRDELGYFKDKCAEQKVVLGKVAGEVRQLEGLRSPRAFALSINSTDEPPSSPIEIVFHAGSVADGAAERKGKLEAGQFAYDPSRTRQHPPAASAAPTGRAYSDPAAGPSQSRSSSRLRLNQREQYAFNEGQSQSREQHQQNLRPDQQVPPHSSPGSSPFLFHPPSMENAVHHSHRQQQHIPRTMSRLSQYEQEDQLMPPPPVPAELRRSQQQVGRPSTYTPIPSSTHGFHPPPPSTTPFGTSAGASHRKPFRPATGGGGGGMGGGFRYG